MTNSKQQSQEARYALIRTKQLLAILPFSSATLWRKVRQGTFVAPIKLGPRITVWKLEDVLAWVAQQEGKQ